MDLLRDISRTTGLPFLDLTPVLADADGSPLPGVLLPRDEHLTPEGSERVAAAMSAFFSERSVSSGVDRIQRALRKRRVQSPNDGSHTFRDVVREWPPAPARFRATVARAFSTVFAPRPF